MVHTAIPQRLNFMMTACCTMSGILSHDHSWTAPHTENIIMATVIRFIWIAAGGEIREVIGLYTG
jgi:hypothetical protein